MRRIKTLLLSLFLLCLVGTSLFFLSLQSEKNYQENCTSLGVACEPGRMQKTYDLLWKKMQPLLQQLKR